MQASPLCAVLDFLCILFPVHSADPARRPENMRHPPNNQARGDWPVCVAVLRGVPIALDPYVARRHLHGGHRVRGFRPDDISWQPNDPLDYTTLGVEGTPMEAQQRG